MVEKRNVRLVIDNVDRTEHLVRSTLSIEDAIGERSTCAFALVDKTGELSDILKPGETVEIWADGVKVFGGSIDKPRSSRTPEGTLRWAIDCVDWHQICDRRIIAETYENQSAGDIVADLAQKYLTAEGIRSTRQQPTFTRSSTAYNPETGEQVGVNEPRYVEGPFAGRKALYVEEGTTNLLTENQSSVETDTTGFLAHGATSTIARATNEAWVGSASLRVTISDTTNWRGVRTPTTLSLTGGTTYTLSFYVKGQGAIRYAITKSGTWTHYVTTSVTLTPSWQRLVLTFTPSTTASDYGVAIEQVNSPVPSDFYIDGLQVEAKPYATSWHLGGTTRSPEVTTIPTAGVFTPGNWTIEFNFKPTSAPNVGTFRRLWHCYIDTNNEWGIVIGADGKPYLSIKSNGTRYELIGTAPSMQIGSWYTIAACGNGTTARFFVNGSKVAEFNYVEPVGTLPTFMYLGKRAGFEYYANGLFDDLRISSRARTDAEILAAYQSNAPLPVDEWTTYKLPLDGSMAAETPIQTGPAVNEAVFNYVSATTCLDTLAERAGYSWWIDPHKVLHFVARATYLAPWHLDENAPISNLQVEDNRHGYRNRQYVKAGKDVTDPQAEAFRGDGASRTWTVGFPIAKVPVVKVNGVPKSVGIKGIDEGKDFYWNKGDPIITQDSEAPVLTASDVLEVTYQGLFDIVVLTDDYAAIEERRAVEGGTGYYEAVDDEPYLSSREAAIQSANAKLRKHAHLSRAITFSTWEPGLRPGQIIFANLPGDRLHNEDFLIDQVTFSEVGSDFYQYHVRAVSGESLGGWATFFRNMATRGQAFVIRENIREDQVLIRLVQSQEAWNWTEVMPVTVHACPIPSANLYPSPTLYPC